MVFIYIADSHTLCNTQRTSHRMPNHISLIHTPAARLEYKVQILHSSSGMCRSMWISVFLKVTPAYSWATTHQGKKPVYHSSAPVYRHSLVIITLCQWFSKCGPETTGGPWDNSNRSRGDLYQQARIVYVWHYCKFKHTCTYCTYSTYIPHRNTTGH